MSAQPKSSSKNKKEKLSFSIKLINISIPKFSFSVPKNFKIPTEGYDYPIEIGTGVFFEESRKVVIIALHIKIFSDGKKGYLVSDLITENVFEVENFNEIVTKKSKNVYNTPDVFLNTLVGISLSTARGIMIEKNSANFLKHIYIPIVKPADLLKPNNNIN